MDRRTSSIALIFTLVAILAGCSGDAPTESDLTAAVQPTGSKIPVTSASTEAIDRYHQAVGLFDRLQAEQARELFAEAVELDPGFALAHLGMANTAQTFREYYDSLERAVESAAGASQAERWWIEGQLAGTNGNPKLELDSYRRLVEAFPDDERAHDLIGTWYFGAQDYHKAVEHCRRATELDPDFSSPYNNLGYAQEALGDFEAAEAAFLKYVDLIPEEPNPYDSYAELLMKTDRYEESIDTYRTALEKDPDFSSSYLGIGHNQIYLRRLDDARATFELLLAESDGYVERRAALLGLASCDLVAGESNAALERLEQRRGIADETGDPLEVASDLRLIARFHLEQGRVEEAEALFEEAFALGESADVSVSVRNNLRRNQIYREAVVAVAKDDLVLARTKANEYARKIALFEGPSELRRAYALEGEIALAGGNFASALSSLAKADQSSPRILWLQADAAHRNGDVDAARGFAGRVIYFNEPVYGYALYFDRARELLQ